MNEDRLRVCLAVVMFCLGLAACLVIYMQAPVMQGTVPPPTL